MTQAPHEPEPSFAAPVVALRGVSGGASRAIRLAAEAAILLLACAFILWAERADTAWFERHVMHSYLVPREHYAHKIVLARVGCAALGLFLLLRGSKLFAGRIAGWLAVPDREAREARPRLAAAGRVALALFAATALCEGVLRHTERRLDRMRQENPPLELRLGAAHPRYGWLPTPSLATVVPLAGRDIEYSFNARSVRTARPDDVIDPARPTVLFAGESIGVGHGLRYAETYAAQVGAMLGAQTVNLSVGGYACDQAYLRLADELPRYERPVAVVTLFLPALLDRTLRDNRPHLALADRGGLVLLPPAQGLWATLRLRRFLRNVVPYHSDSQNQAMLELVGAIFSETARLAREKGAAPLFLIPSLGAPRPLDDHPEAWIIHELFEARKLPYVLVDLDPAWTLAHDGHPDPRAARRMAEAIVHTLPRR